MQVLLKTLSSRWSLKSVHCSRDQTNLRFALYRKSEKPMSRCIVFFNGRTEWIEKNMELPEQFQIPDDCGWLTWDHRGQGASGGPRGVIDSYDDYVFDARCMIEEAIGKTPYSIVAHSMGGLISLHGTLSKELRPYKMVLSSPLFRLPQEPIPRFIAAPLASTLHHLGLSTIRTGAGSHHKAEFARNKLTHDYHMYRIICESPYRLPSANIGWVHQTFKATESIFLPSRIKDLTSPTLVLTAEQEEVVDPRGHSSWVQAARRHAKVETQLTMIHGGRHELYSETPEIRDRAIHESRQWLSDFLA